MQAYEFKSVPGYEHTLVWVDPTTPNLRNGQGFVRYPESVVPGPGGTSLHFVTFPPSSVFADPSFDGEAARREALIRLRGLADHFEKEDPAMHKTNTVDYAVVYDGEIWLELDDAKTVHLKRGMVPSRYEITASPNQLAPREPHGGSLATSSDRTQHGRD